MWAGFAAYLGVLAWAPRLGARVVWGLIGLALLAFACLPPLLSHDVYSYIDYARLDRLHDLNPYLHPPGAAKGDPAFSHVTWKSTASTYGPLFTLASYPLAWIPVGTAVYVLKAAAAAAVLATAVLLARLAPSRGVDPLRAAAFLALNPLVLVHVIGGPHNDAFTALLMTLGFAAVLTAREASAGAALVAAIAVKASAALAAPFALMATLNRQSTGGKPESGSGFRPVGRFLAGAAVAALAIGGVAWVAFGWHWLDAFALASENQGRTSHMSIPITAARLTGISPEMTRLLAFVAFFALIVYLLGWTWRGGDWLRATAWATAGLLLATAWLLPWYLLWPLPAAALSRDRLLQVLILGLTAYQLGARIPL